MKRMFWLTAVAALAGTAAPSADAQVRAIAPRALSLASENPNAARIGVYLGDNDLRDTLGVLVSSVMEDGPAARAGVRAGDRITAIDGVNLRMTRVDAEDPMLRGMMSRRLTRTLDAKSAGDEVELRLWSENAARTVRVKTVAARELTQARERVAAPLLGSRMDADRAALGINLGGSASKRDTLGVLVIGITADGPAEKAGLVEGDRIARFNDIDLRVPREDAGDVTLSHARVNRLSREIGRLSPGDAVTLTVWSGGRQREVRVTAVRASELRSGNVQMFIGDGAFVLPRLEGFNMRTPRISIPDVDIRIPEIDIRTYVPEIDVRARIQESLEAARRARTQAIERSRRAVEDAQRDVRTIRARNVIRTTTTL